MPMLFILLILLSPVAVSQPTEEEIKAVALEKLALFIEWPKSAGLETREEFTIAVYDGTEFSDILKNIYRNHTIKSRKVRVVTFTDTRKIPACQILFVPRVKKSTLTEILDKTRKMPVLTVADTKGFADEGCCVNFMMDTGRLRFEINQTQMVDLGFEVDYKLLNIAKVVNPAQNQ